MWKDYQEIDWENGEYDENGEWVNYDVQDEEEEETFVVKDANWNILQDWDSVAAIKDLPVKWSQNIKRWDKFTKIRLIDNPDQFESWKLVLRAEYFKKL